MFIKIVSVVSMLFVLANAAKYKVTSTEKNLRMTKEQQIKAVKNVHQHIGSVKTKMSKPQSSHDKIKKRVEDVMKLQSWNPYDSSFDTEMWFIYMGYSGSDCTDNLVQQYVDYESYCYVGEFKTSEGQTYQSAQSLFKSDCSEETVVFYSSDDCSGDPEQQGNTDPISMTMDMNNCEPYSSVVDDDEYYAFSESIKFYCSDSMVNWDGGDAVQTLTYEQTSTCSGTPSDYSWILGGCYQTGITTSVQYSSGPTMNEYTASTDCTGDSTQISISGCTESDDDDDDDDDDGLLDDGMFTDDTVVNTDTSMDISWNASSMGAILNYSMSIALVFMACSLL